MSAGSRRRPGGANNKTGALAIECLLPRFSSPTLLWVKWHDGQLVSAWVDCKSSFLFNSTRRAPSDELVDTKSEISKWVHVILSWMIFNTRGKGLSGWQSSLKYVNNFSVDCTNICVVRFWVKAGIMTILWFMDKLMARFTVWVWDPWVTWKTSLRESNWNLSWDRQTIPKAWRPHNICTTVC